MVPLSSCERPCKASPARAHVLVSALEILYLLFILSQYTAFFQCALLFLSVRPGSLRLISAMRLCIYVIVHS